MRSGAEVSFDKIVKKSVFKWHYKNPYIQGAYTLRNESIFCAIRSDKKKPHHAEIGLFTDPSVLKTYQSQGEI